MEHIHIISKEPVTAFADWQACIILIICIAAIASSFVYWNRTKDHEKTFKYLIVAGLSAIAFELIAISICNVFFAVPTGEYKYRATIDKEKITVTQYEEFIEECNPTIKDGIYYWNMR